MRRPYYWGKPFYIVFLTYLCMLLLPALLSLLALRGTGNGIITSIEKSNDTVAERYSVNVEAQLQQITLLSYELNNNPILKALARTKSFSPEQRISVHRFLSQSAALLAQYPIVYDFYIYFSANDTILSSTGTYSGLWYYNDNISRNGPTYQEWKELLTRQYARATYLPRDSGLVSPGDAGKYVLCARSLLNGGGSSAATIVIKVPKDAIRDKCLSSNYSADGVASLYSGTGELIASAGSNTYVHFDHARGTFAANDASTLLSVNEIPSMSAFLVYALPDSAYTSQLWSAYTQMKETLLLILFAGLSLASVFSYLVYRPLDKLVLWVCQKDQSAARDRDSYGLIRRAFDQLFAKQEQTAMELYRMKSSMGEEYLLKLLEGRQPRDENIREKLTGFSLDFPYPNIWVMVCEDKQNALDRAATYEGFISMLYRSIPCESLLYRVNIDETRLALLLCCAEPADKAAADTLEARIGEWTARQSIADLHIGLGGQSGLDDLHASYGLALEALSSLFLCPGKVVLRSDNLRETGEKYHYTAEKENLLIQHAMRRDSEGTFALLDELFDENIARRKLNLEMTRLFLYALLDTAFKIENALNIAPDSATQNPVAMVTSCASIDEARTQVKFIYGILCDPGRDEESRMSAATSWRVYKIADYINAHYLDSSLSLDSTAEHFRITPQYLSAIFKKGTNENFSVYVQKLRLEHSKTLMTDQQLTLNIIAERSGFNNYLALSRAFQKFFGMPPGAYRQSI